MFIEIRGRTCRLSIEDRGNINPAYDDQGNPFRAYTTLFQIDVPQDFSPEGKYPIIEAYSQVDEYRASDSGDPERFRLREDAAVLDGMLETLGATKAEVDSIFAGLDRGSYQPARP